MSEERGPWNRDFYRFLWQEFESTRDKSYWAGSVSEWLRVLDDADRHDFGPAWHVLASIPSRYLGTTGEFSLPAFAIRFVVEYLRGKGHKHALDPVASQGTATLLAAVVQTSVVGSATGVVQRSGDTLIADKISEGSRTTPGGEDLYVRSTWRYQDATLEIDLFIRDFDGATEWFSAQHNFRAGGPGYRSPFAASR